MLYVGIDQHKRHLTICIRDEQGEIVLRRQVKTTWTEVDRFLGLLQAWSEPDNGYVAILEVCGFNDWLIERLNRLGCSQVYVIAPPTRVRQKTDRRDAAKLSELLWINRDRIATGQRLIHVSVVYQPTKAEQYDRHLTRLRHRLGQELTRVKNNIKGILRRHNLEQECPTKGMFTQTALRWLTQLSLPEMHRIELSQRLAQYEFYRSEMDRIDALIYVRARSNTSVLLLRTLPKIGNYTALALLAYIGPIDRFPRARSLANFFGITPGCRNSGESDRPGSITKAGHPFVRFLLGQMVLHALRGDVGLRQWYRQVKHRRGAKIARVAVMRRLCESLWHMLSKREAYQPVGSQQAASARPHSRPAA
jgi:transposase